MHLDPAAVATGLAVVGTWTAIGAAGSYFIARREQDQNEKTISEVRGVIRNVSTISAGDLVIHSVGTQSPEAISQEKRLLDAVAGRAAARFQIQEAHYSNALRQSTTYFYASVMVGLVGFVLLMTGVGLAFSELIGVGTVTGIGGLLTDAAAALVFSQANRAKKDAQDNLFSIAQTAEKYENYIMAFVYASGIEDTSVRDATNALIARSLVTGAVGLASTLTNDGPPSQASGESGS